METREYEAMFRCEEEHWWYWGLRDLVVARLSLALRGRRSPQVLDAGCGTGKLLEVLHARSIEAQGVDLSWDALRFVRERGLSGFARASIVQLPLESDQFDAVVSNDVLCCVDPDQVAQALSEFRRVLKPSGVLLMNLPAYPWLRSGHDMAVHIRQRFTKKGLEALLGAAGFTNVRLTYRNTILFPLVALVRLAGRARLERGEGAPESDVYQLPKVLNAILKLPLAIENRWLGLGAGLPFGLSVYCEARRP